MAEDNGNRSTVEATTAEQAPEVSDYLISPDAVLGDKGVEWRYGRPPDYSKTRKVWEETKSMNHVAGSLPQLVENLVKNWEVEASFKPRLQDWRTIDHQKYTFAMNGGRPQTAEHMLKVGTYNAIIAPNEYYSPKYSDFAASHKTFKRMMPTFAWEVIEVYSGPPTVAFKWRHWGEMKNDYVAFNDKGEKITAKAHGGPIEIFGVTVANVDDQIRLQAIDTWMDPLAMFRQIAPYGVVDKSTTNHKVDTTNIDKAISESSGFMVDHEYSNPAGPGADLESENGSREPHPYNAGQGGSADSHNLGFCPFLAQSSPSHETAADRKQLGSDLAVSFPPESEFPTDQEPQVVPLPATEYIPQYSSAVTNAGGLHHEVEMDVEQPRSSGHEDTTVDLGNERPKLDGDGQDLIDQGSRISSKPVSAFSQPLQELPRSVYSSSITGDVENVIRSSDSEECAKSASATGTQNTLGSISQNSASGMHTNPNKVETAVVPDAGEAVAAPIDSKETRQTYEEMSTVTPIEQEELMNQE